MGEPYPHARELWAAMLDVAIAIDAERKLAGFAGDTIDLVVGFFAHDLPKTVIDVVTTAGRGLGAGARAVGRGLGDLVGAGLKPLLIGAGVLVGAAVLVPALARSGGRDRKGGSDA